MAFSELIKERYSARSFKPEEVDAEKLAAILEAGRIAPTACNNQPQRIKVITDAAELAKVDECTPCRFNAPLVLLVCYDKSQCWTSPFNGELSGQVDASIVTTHLTLAAKDQGLDSCWVMYFDPEKTRALFGLPEDIIPVAYLPIGHVTEDCEPADRHFERKALEELLLG
jgi:nitroreductase